MQPTADVPGQLLVGDGCQFPLTPREFRLLTYLLRRAGAVVSRDELLATVWGPEADVLPREVDSYVYLLRRKLEPDPGRPRYLFTVWGRGYRYQVPKTTPATNLPARAAVRYPIQAHGPAVPDRRSITAGRRFATLVGVLAPLP